MPDRTAQIERHRVAEVMAVEHSKGAKNRARKAEQDAYRALGQMEGFQQVIGLMQKHIEGLDPLVKAGSLTEEQRIDAVRWIREVMGIPGNLLEGSRIVKIQAEGAANAMLKMSDDYDKEAAAQRARIAEIENGEAKTSDIEERRAETATKKNGAAKKSAKKKAAKKSPKGKRR